MADVSDTDTESAFQAAIDAAPLDKLPRLVFCDWLDELGDERANGMRVLAEYDRWPWWWSHDGTWMWYGHTEDLVANPSNLSDRLRADQNYIDRCELPDDWCRNWEEDFEFPTRREAHDTAALAWLTLTAEQRAACLAELDRITGRTEAKSP